MVLKTSKKLLDNEIPNAPLRFLWHVTKPHKWWAFGAVTAVIFGELVTVFEIYTISRLVDDFSTAPDVAAQLDVLVFWGTVFIILMFVGKFLWRVSGFVGIKWLVESNATSYKNLYEYLMNHSHSYFSDRFAGAVSNKVSNATDGTTRISERTMWGTLPEVVSLIATIIFFGFIHYSLALVMVVVLILLILFNLYRVQKRRPYVVEYAAASSKVRGEGVDLITNIAAARQYVRQTEELTRLGDAIDDRRRKDLKQWFMGEWLLVANSITGFLMSVLVVVVVYVLLHQGLATAGNLVLVLMLLSRVAYLFNMIGNMMNMYVRVYGEIQEGLEAILLPHEILDVSQAKQLTVQHANIDFRNVNFAFAGQSVFQDFSVSIGAGQRVGLVGQSGAGKTTFVSLLLRQHDIQSGTITIDGQDISKVTQNSLRKHIAVVPQEPLLFHRTIRENILYGNPDATADMLVEAAKRAQAHEFIEALPDGYDTLVGERGIKLSGGQKQRVAIARAMLKDAPILVLDEATSALDSESEVLIQKALEELMEGRTVIAIAHRLSTLRKMDRIIVMENGQIIEDGTHETLAAGGGMYQRLWDHQAGGFLVE